MKFKQFITEASNLEDIDTFVKTLKDNITKIFPKSFVYVEYESNIAPGITIRFALGKDKSEFGSGIWQNDPAWCIIHVGMGQIKKGQPITGEISAESSTAGMLMTKDYKRIKVQWKKKTGPVFRIVSHINDYFTRLKQAVKDNKNNLVDYAKDKV